MCVSVCTYVCVLCACVCVCCMFTCVHICCVLCACVCVCGVYMCMCLPVCVHCTYTWEGRQRWRLHCHFRQAPLCGPPCSNSKMQEIFLHQEEAGDPLSAGPHEGASLHWMESPGQPHPARPTTTQPCLSPCPTHQQHRLPFCSLKTPGLTLHRAFAPALSRPAALLCSRWGEPCLSLRPWIHCPPTERSSPTT